MNRGGASVRAPPDELCALNLENCFWRSSELHFGHAGLRLPMTSVSNWWPHAPQVNSNRGITDLGYHPPLVSRPTLRARHEDVRRSHLSYRNTVAGIGLSIPGRSAASANAQIVANSVRVIDSIFLGSRNRASSDGR